MTWAEFKDTIIEAVMPATVAELVVGGACLLTLAIWGDVIAEAVRRM